MFTYEGGCRVVEVIECDQCIDLLIRRGFAVGVSSLTDFEIQNGRSGYMIDRFFCVFYKHYLTK